MSAEQDPSLRLQYGTSGEFVDISAVNTTLYTFMGRTVIGDMIVENESVNHAFVELNRTSEGVPTGMYLFAEFHEVYPVVASFAVENKLPMMLNRRDIPECDLKVYLTELDKATAKFGAQIPDSLPEDFK